MALKIVIGVKIAEASWQSSTRRRESRRIRRGPVSRTVLRAARAPRYNKTRANARACLLLGRYYGWLWGVNHLTRFFRQASTRRAHSSYFTTTVTFPNLPRCPLRANFITACNKKICRLAHFFHLIISVDKKCPR